MNKKFIYALSTLAGTIIGAGLFSLPYITSKVGLWVMLAYFLILGLIAFLIHFFYAQVSLRTPNFLRLPGFAKIHLGKWGERTAFFSTVLGIFGALLAYLILGGEFLEELLSPLLGGNNLIYTLSYFALGAVFIFFGVRAITKVEFLGLILFFVAIAVIFLEKIPSLQIGNLFSSPDPSQLFLPYGAILFSLWGGSIIPEIEEILGKQTHLFKKVIAGALLISIILYLFFIFVVVGLAGPQTSQTALSGFENFLGGKLFRLILVFGIFATFTSVLTLGLTLKKVFWYDLKLNKHLSWAVTCFIPLVLFLAGIRSFIDVISMAGGIMIGINALLILMMYKKVYPRRHRALIYPMFLVFLGGIIYEIIYFLC